MKGGNRAERRHQRAVASEVLTAAGHRAAGRLESAELICRKILQKSPENIDALHLMGLVVLERGEPRQAIQILGEVVTRSPDFAHAHANLGNAYRAAGRPADARASYRRAVALQPRFAPAHTHLGLLLYEQGDLAGALSSCQRAFQLEPDNPDVINNLGNVCAASGQKEQAEKLLHRAVERAPERADIHVNLGNVLIELGRFDEAAGCYRRAVEVQPGLARAHFGLATSRRLAGDIAGAIESYRNAIQSGGRQPAYWNDLGTALRGLGRFAEAADAFRQALEIDPDFADAYRNLANCRQISPDEANFERLAALVEHPKLPPEERVTAGFALGKALDDADRFDAAFAAYEQANKTYRALRWAAGDRFDPKTLRRQVNESIAIYTPEFFAAVAGRGALSDLPVFIVGMPRSGSSLIEQIAASHSRVFGAGELKDIGKLSLGLGPVTADADPADIRRLADAHLERLRSLGPGADRVIDKLPDNVFLLGVIATLFPSARVVFCDRDPRDIALSCFFQKFAPGELTFSYDLADIGTRQRETARLMEHWRRVLPLHMLDIRYEALVSDPEGESRRVVDFLGLAWEPACLDFHQTQRTVMTASSWQVRQPLYKRSVGRWRHYEQHLASSLTALDAEYTASN